MADKNPYPVNPSRPQGGTKLDDTFPDGLGQPAGGDDPVLPSRQPVKTTGDVRKRPRP
ncbi:MAG: hypothetical protein WCA27_30045 [Candidatus Sulfotelmatobacter sp.]